MQELQFQMSEQDKLIAELEKLVQSDRQKQVRPCQPPPLRTSLPYLVLPEHISARRKRHTICKHCVLYACCVIHQDDEREVMAQQLAVVQKQLSATSAELAAAKAQLEAEPEVDVAALQAEIERLGQVEARLQAAEAQLVRLAEIDELQDSLAEAQAQLEEQRRVADRLASDLEAAREELAAASGAAAAAKLQAQVRKTAMNSLVAVQACPPRPEHVGSLASLNRSRATNVCCKKSYTRSSCSVLLAYVAQEAEKALALKVEELAAIEADVENMRKTMNKGGRKGKGKVQQARAAKGFASPAPAPTPARPDAGAENHLRQELKQAQVRGVVERCRPVLACREVASLG